MKKVIRVFDLYRAVALLLVTVSVALLFEARDTPGFVQNAGLIILSLSLTIYLFAFRGLPVHRRPPVKFHPLALWLITAFCFGSTLCGAGLAGWPYAMHPLGGHTAIGLALMIVPTTIALLLTLYLSSESGRILRTNLAHRAELGCESR